MWNPVLVKPIRPGSERPLPTGSHSVPSLEKVFRDHAPRIYELALRLLPNRADAEEATQEVFLLLARKLATFRGQSAFPTWLYRITVTAALKYRQKRDRREGHPVPEYVAEQTAGGGSNRPAPRCEKAPPSRLLDRELHQVIETATDRLP